MGIFIKFECSNCGEYECNCLNNNSNNYTYVTEQFKVPTNGVLYKGDIVCEALDENNNAINQFLVTGFTKDGIPIGKYIMGDGKEIEYLVTKFYKICNSTINEL